VARRYHHIGIPTDKPRAGERYHPDLKFYSSGLDDSEFGIEWMRFEPGCPIPEQVRRVAHVAFVVDDLASELEGRRVIIEPNSPSAGVTVAFIDEDGAPVELMQFGG
jgi:hypothetical protein